MAFEWNTLHGTLEALFPKGTAEGTRSYSRCPVWSTTLFGAAAYLLERGGVYHRLIPETESKFAFEANHGGPPFEWQPPSIVVPANLVDRCRSLGRKWYDEAINIKAAATSGDSKSLHDGESALKDVLAQISQIWEQLVSFHELPVVLPPSYSAPLEWWLPALELFIIADEASQNFGFADQKGSSHPLEMLLQSAIERQVYKDTTNEGHVLHSKQPPVFAPLLNVHLARIVPKSRTPAVGCTMRALSHNLALVPPEGIVDLYWFRELRSFPEDREPLNVLLIPFPYFIPATAFKALSQNNQVRPEKHQWGWFRVEQTWLRPGDDGTSEGASEQIAAFVCDLLDSAERDVGRVHGIVLPELALDWQCYATIVTKIQKRRPIPRHDGSLPPLDFLVAGLSSEETGLRGNYVATTTFTLDDKEACVAATYHRSKHHRWQLTGSQITNYALGSALDPNVVWWEANDVPKREIGLTVFRRGAVFSAMICEDLARSEPCHEPLRAVGPNLVLVLLMDGPQTPNRWSARYATSLADDPGSSVLTLTSLGLIERANRIGQYKPSRHVALWKDDSGQTIQIECPKDEQGVVVTLSGMCAEESTLDGRTNEDTQTWRYRGHQPVRISAAARSTKSFDHLLSPT